MFGISWGGFNGLQVAARRPPALKAVISMCATDDRYADDVHYIGGCVLALDMLPWAATMLTLLRACRPTRPPSATAGARRGSQRLERTPPFVEPWLAHQRRDAYWRHGSVCEDYARDRGPRSTRSAAGPTATQRDPAAARGPARAAQGPDRPVVARLPAGRRARPGDRLPPGVPALVGPLAQGRRHRRSWTSRCCARGCRSPSRPAGHHAERPGRWVAEPAWPPPRIDAASGRSPRTLRAAPTPRAPRRAPHRSLETTGQDAGAWCADGGAGDWPGRPARRGRPLARRFTSAAARRAARDPRLPGGRARGRGRPPARARRGAPVRRRPRRRVAARHPRRCSTSPTATATTTPRRSSPGRRYDVRVRLDAIAQRVPAGHRLRVAISTVVLAVGVAVAGAGRRSRSHGRQPAGAARRARRATRRRAAPTSARRSGPSRWRSGDVAPGPTSRTLDRDLATGAHELRFEWDVGGHRRLVDGGPEIDDTNVTTYRIVDGDPLSASVRVRCSSTLARGDWHTRVETDSRHDRDRDRVPRHATASTPTRATSASTRARGRSRSRATKRVGHPALEGGDQVLAGQQQLAVLEHARGHPALHGLDERASSAPTSSSSAMKSAIHSGSSSAREEVVEHAVGAPGATGVSGPIDRFGAPGHDVDLQRRPHQVELAVDPAAS